MAKNFIVDSENRLDRFLAGKLDYSRERIKEFIRAGYTKINGSLEKKPSKKVLSGDKIRVSIPAKPKGRKITEKLIPQDVDFEVLYEDKHVLAVNKPSGIVVHPACKHPDKTLLNGVVKYLQDNGEKDVNPRPVHRLDKDTSGVILIAKSEEALFKLAKQFEGREVSKQYDALVHGLFYLPEFTEKTREKLELRLDQEGKWSVFGCNLRRSKEDRRKIVVGEDGRWAVSKFRVKHSCEGASWLKIRLVTGRTHQIRAQVNFLGFPVIGDMRYSTRKQLAQSEDWFNDCELPPRMMLHASYLKIDLPDGKKHEFKAELPVEMTMLYKSICNE